MGYSSGPVIRSVDVDGRFIEAEGLVLKRGAVARFRFD
jgi:hypothetical protein